MDPKLSHTLPSFPPQNGVDFETHNHDKRARQKPDLRLAESYIPAALLTLKICFYTTMIPLVLFTQSRFSIMIISLYTIVLYFDHIYLVFTKNPFIDSTAVCLDILASNILCLVFPKNAQALFPTIIFVIWGICGSIYIAVIPSQKTSSREFYRFCTHIVTVLIFVSLLSTDATAGEPPGDNQQYSNYYHSYRHVSVLLDTKHVLYSPGFGRFVYISTPLSARI